MSNAVVVVNASVQNAPVPSRLQQSVAAVSVGGTSTLGTASSGAYNATTGLVTLTMAAPTTLTPGAGITVDDVTGTGSYASASGTFTCQAGTGGSTVTYNIPAGLTLTITGASISNTLVGVTSLAGLTSILEQAITLSGATYSGGTVTATTSTPHGWNIGDTVNAIITGCLPNGYNTASGSYTAITITGASTFTYPKGTLGSITQLGSVILADESELLQMGSTFFAQGGSQFLYILELGEQPNAGAPAALGTWISNNPTTIYAYMVPREWDGLSGYKSLVGQYTANNSFTYFFTTTSIANGAASPQPYAGVKAVFAEVEAPQIGSTEFSIAGALGVVQGWNPSSSNRVPPLCYAFVNGVTPYPIPGNQTLLSTLNTNNVGYIDTAAEGGLTNAMLKFGQLCDGNPFNFWYSADWAQINLDLDLANEVINGSNNTLAPLYYDQDGINRLQNRGRRTLATGLAYGLGVGVVKTYQLPAAQFAANYEAGEYVGQIALNAEPFLVYSAENPSDYAIGKYAGLAAVWTPSRGFKQVFFNLTVTNLIVP